MPAGLALGLALPITLDMPPPELPSRARPQSAEGLLEDTWDERDRRLGRRERRVEWAATLGLLAAALALELGVAAVPSPAAPGAWVALVVAFALVSRVEFPVGAGSAVPSQLVLVPMLFVLGPTHVPLLVAVGSALGRVVDWLAGRAPADRIVFAGGDAWHALGPALVLVLAGQPELRVGLWPVLVGAVAAQCAADALAASAREWLVLGVPPALQLRVIGLVWIVDVLLTPVAVLAAHAGRHDPYSALAVVPLAGLLALLARDRKARIDQAQDRLEALRHERGRLQTAVRRIGEAFASRLDLDAVLLITLRTAAEAVGAGQARASVGPAAGLPWRERAVVGEDAGLDEALARAEARVRTIDAPAQVQVEGGFGLACPLGAEGDVGARVEGALALARADRPFTEDEQALFGYLVEQASRSAADVLRHEQLHHQALTDELTGLANHRRLQDVLRARADAWLLDGEPCALVLVDLDDFKQVNDVHGHQAGDQVLRAVARLLRADGAAGAEAARYGGEELALVLPGAAPAQAGARAERLRAAVAGLEVARPGGEALRVTASFGVAALGGAVRDPATLIAAADAALYAAKRAGKDRVEIAPEAPRAAPEAALA